MMLLAPHPRSPVAELLRVLAAWLAAIVLVQGLAAAQALGQGPLHRHRAVAALTAFTDTQHDLLRHRRHHIHHHEHAERHSHGVADPSVLRVGGDPGSIDAAAFALTAALTLMLLGAGLRSAPDVRRHVWRHAPAWAWRTVFPAGLLRPPQPG